MMKTTVPSRKSVRVSGIIITTNPSRTATPWKTLRCSEKGRSFVFRFSHNFLHIDLVGVPILSHEGCNFAHYFQEEINALFFALHVPEVGSNYCAVQLCQVAGRQSCALCLVKTCDPLNSKH